MKQITSRDWHLVLPSSASLDSFCRKSAFIQTQCMVHKFILLAGLNHSTPGKETNCTEILFLKNATPSSSCQPHDHQMTSPFLSFWFTICLSKWEILVRAELLSSQLMASSTCPTWRTPSSIRVRIREENVESTVLKPTFQIQYIQREFCSITWARKARYMDAALPLMEQGSIQNLVFHFCPSLKM